MRIERIKKQGERLGKIEDIRDELRKKIINNKSTQVKHNKSTETVEKEKTPFISNQKKIGVSIIISAYQAQDFIEECLDSIENQTYFKNNDKYEILLGIDACEDTLKKIQTIKHKYRNLKVFMMMKNVGWPTTTNTLLKQLSYDNFIRFDADDIMCNNMVEEIMKKPNFDVTRFKFSEFGGSVKEGYKYSEGVISYNKKIFEEYGGFQPWICGSDTELLLRIDIFGKDLKINKINKILFKRRVHSQSLTQDPKTGRGSSLRKHYQKKIRQIKNKPQKKITPITIYYLSINSNEYGYFEKNIHYNLNRFKNNETIGIIRSCGERTTDICYKQLKSQVSKIEIVEETPSYKATQKQYDIAIKSGCKWLISVDADEMIFPGIVEDLISFILTKGKNAYSAYGLIKCKLLLNERDGVPRIYNINHLKKAINFIRDDIRPDAFICNKMESLGYPQYLLPKLLAYHDYEQYYVDIYRKAYIHAIKFTDLMKEVHKKWEKLLKDDLDYKAALIGYNDGLKHKGVISINRNYFDDKKIINKLGFAEKEKLEITEELLEFYNLKNKYEWMKI